MDTANQALLQIEEQGVHIALAFQETLIAQEQLASETDPASRECAEQLVDGLSKKIEQMMDELAKLGTYTELWAVVTRTLPGNPPRPLRNRRLVQEAYPSSLPRFSLRVESEIVRCDDGTVKIGWAETVIFEQTESPVILLPSEFDPPDDGEERGN